jgi:hypothetical protein
MQMKATPGTLAGLISFTILFNGVYGIGLAQAGAGLLTGGATGESQQALFNIHKCFRRNNHR